MDIDDTTIAIGDTLYELDGLDIGASHYIGSEIDVGYITSIDVSDQSAVIASRERPQEGAWVYERANGQMGFP